MFLSHPGQIPELDPIQVFERIQRQPTHFLLDVRTRGEFSEVHATSAINIPLDQLNVKNISANWGVSLDTPIYVICRSGGRSYQAALLLKAAGFKDVYNVSTGTIGWVDQGLPINEESNEVDHQILD